MPKFSYKAKEGPSKIVDGIIEAQSADLAINKIIQQGLTPIDVEQSTNGQSVAKEKQPSKGFRFGKKVSQQDIVQFTRQMNDLVDASVPILRSLQIVSQQTQNVYFQNMINQIYTIVKDGGAFSDALAQYPQVFPSLYVNMIRTGEVSGQLEKVLGRLADYLEKEHETANKVKSSLAYPALILIVGILTIFVLLSFVIPRISVMFDDLDQALPLPTQILMNASGFFAQYWWLMTAVVIMSGIYFRRWIGSEKGKWWFDELKLKIPLLGRFTQVVEIGRFSRTLGTLVESNVSITTALHSVWTVIDNAILREEIKQVSDEVANGSSLKGALDKCSFFPEMATNMIAVGEETARLEKGLYKIADTFEREADQTVKTMISLLGPLVLVVIVAIVGVVVISMLLPIFQMNLLVS